MSENLVTVLACNEYSYTKTCIKRLFETTKTDFDLLLINNSFNDNKCVELVYEELKEQYPRINYIDNKKNLGIACSLNQAIDFFIKGGYQYFFQFHTDNYVSQNWLENFLEAKRVYKLDAVAPLEQNDHYHFPKVNAEWDQKLQNNKIFFNTSDELEQHINNIFRNDYDNISKQIEEEHKWVYIPKTFSFSAYMLSRDVIKYVGYFDEQFYPGGYEDRDYHERMEGKFLSFGKVGRIFVVHWGSITFHHKGDVDGRSFVDQNRLKFAAKLKFEQCKRKTCTSNKDGFCGLGTNPCDISNASIYYERK